MNTEYELFFLNMKKELNNINYHLYEIIKVYESLNTSIDNFKKDNPEEDLNQEEKEGKQILRLKFIEFMEYYNSKMDETTTMKNHIEDLIKENCEHNFIDDTIDSGLDKTANIQYCTKCYKVNE
jgi:hypothetical protein